jgi:MFS family permease
VFRKSLQYYKFCAYGFLKNLRFFDVFLILFFRETGLSYLQIGTLYSVRQIAINIFEVPSGLVADLLGRKNALLFSFLSYILSFLLFYFSLGYSLFFVSMFAFGIGEAFRSGTHKAMILAYLEHNDLLEHKTAYYGHTRSWSQFGSAISSLGAMLIVFFSHNYRSVFLFTIIPYVLDLLLVASYPSSLNLVRPRETMEKIGPRLLQDFRLLWSKFLLLIRRPESVRGIFSAAAYIGFFKSTKDYLQPVLEVTAMSLPLYMAWSGERRSAVLIGIVYFLIYLLTSATSRNAWRMERRFHDIKKAIDQLYLWGIAGIGLSGIFLYIGWKVPAILLFIVLFVVQNLRRPMVVSFLGSVIDSGILASGLSMESQFQTLLIFIFAPVLGLLCDTLGIAGGLIISSLLFLLIYPLIRLQGRNPSV